MQIYAIVINVVNEPLNESFQNGYFVDCTNENVTMSAGKGQGEASEVINPTYYL